MAKAIEAYDFDAGSIAESRDLIVGLGGRKLPVIPETWVCNGYTDSGQPKVTFYRKSGATGFHATEYMA